MICFRADGQPWGDARVVKKRPEYAPAAPPKKRIVLAHTYGTFETVVVPSEILSPAPSSRFERIRVQLFGLLSVLVRKVRALPIKRVSPHEQACRILNFWSVFLPMRVNKEDLGNYCEDITKLAARGERWLLALRVVSAIFWTGIAGVREIMSALLGKSATK